MMDEGHQIFTGGGGGDDERDEVEGSVEFREPILTKTELGNVSKVNTVEDSDIVSSNDVYNTTCVSDPTVLYPLVCETLLPVIYPKSPASVSEGPANQKSTTTMSYTDACMSTMEPLPRSSPDNMSSPTSPTNSRYLHCSPDQNMEESKTVLPLLPSCKISVNLSSQPTGIQWSPCGQFLAFSTDTKVEVCSPWQVEESLSPSTRVRQAECLYDWQWVNHPTLSNCSLMVTTGRYQPVHLYKYQDDTGQLEVELAGTYKCINNLDELSHSFSVAIDHTAKSLYCGLKGEVRVFDVARPGRESYCHVTKGRTGQNGIVSCIAVSDLLPVYAVGCYDRTVGVYSEQGTRLCVLRGQMGGVTQVTFSRDGSKLFSGGRKDNEILCWDLRQPGMVLYTLQREVITNQTIQFTLSPCGHYLCSANTDGSVRIWSLDGQVDSDTGVLEPETGWLLHRDVVNGVSWHPGGDWLATCSGQRHFKLEKGMELDGEMIEGDDEENSVALWQMS